MTQTRMWRSVLGLVLAGVLAMGAAPAAAQPCCGCQGSCSAGGNTYFCDVTCTDESCDISRTHSSCDSACTDGVCVLCNVDNGINDPVVIDGTGGDDVICVRSGNSGTGVETYEGKGGDDVIAVRANDGYGDNLDGGSNNDTIYGGAADDVIVAGGGNDTVYAGDGNDTITTNGGTDTINGDGGDDTITGSGAAETLNGGDGDDVITAAGGDDTIDGGAGRSIIYAGSGNDDITTSAGSAHEALGSIICGEGNDDTITASGYGHTCVDCGSGTDSLAYTAVLPACDGDIHDVATAAGCETTSGDPPIGDSVCGCP